MELIEGCLPLIAMVCAPRFDEGEMQQMSSGWERHFARGERYAVLVVWPRDATLPSPRDRKLITDWVNDPRVLAMTKKLCVGSATVVESPLARGAYTALQWFWKPPFPLQAVGTVAEGLEYCLDRIESAELPMRASRQDIRIQLLNALSGVL